MTEKYRIYTRPIPVSEPGDDAPDSGPTPPRTDAEVAELRDFMARADRQERVVVARLRIGPSIRWRQQVTYIDGALSEETCEVMIGHHLVASVWRTDGRGQWKAVLWIPWPVVELGSYARRRDAKRAVMVALSGGTVAQTPTTSCPRRRRPVWYCSPCYGMDQDRRWRAMCRRRWLVGRDRMARKSLQIGRSTRLARETRAQINAKLWPARVA